MTDAEVIEKLLAACKAYHQALDMAFVTLISKDREFFPTKSPMWPAVVSGKALMDEIEREKAR